MQGLQCHGEGEVWNKHRVNISSCVVAFPSVGKQDRDGYNRACGAKSYSPEAWSALGV